MSGLPPQLESQYEFVREMGRGAYGLVISAMDRRTNQSFAIKKLTRIFDKQILAKRALREIKLLRHFNGHENITSIFNMDLVDPDNYNEIFVVQELMEADLHQIIRSEQPLTDAHYQYFIYQTLRGLKYIHSANVLHRDLKPGNLLVNADCELKICDFGLARGYSATPDVSSGFMTEYVATRWYRAPEIMLSFRSYSKAIDLWSVGCILAELLLKKPLFKGKDYVDQLNQILQVCGTPDDETLERIGSPRAQMYIKSLPRFPKIPMARVCPGATGKAIDFLEKVLDFDPDRRMTCEQALEHPYLESYHDVNDEPTHKAHFDFSFEVVESLDDLKKMIAAEIFEFKKQLPQ
ncbi:kinase-like domain-containing protein [Gorgonomyces haynaldii]|nr:kinase-like domain-containing protein [Gorgonomyces haynaldii]